MVFDSMISFSFSNTFFFFQSINVLKKHKKMIHDIVQNNAGIFKTFIFFKLKTNFNLITS